MNDLFTNDEYIQRIDQRLAQLDSQENDIKLTIASQLQSVEESRNLLLAKKAELTPAPVEVPVNVEETARESEPQG